MGTMNAGKTSIKKIFNYSKRWLICCLFFLAACGDGRSKTILQYNKMIADSIAQVQLAARAFTQIRLLQPMIRSGDLITRTGNDFTSESLRKFNQRDQTFSHCGIASIENDSIFIYHALGGEFNPDEKLKREPLQLFGEAFNNRGIGIFRYTLQPKENAQLISTVKKWYQDGLMFDMQFDLDTNDRMYCAEFVYKALTTAAAGRFVIKKSHIKDFEFVGVDDLYLQTQCVELKRILYK